MSRHSSSAIRFSSLVLATLFSLHALAGSTIDGSLPPESAKRCAQPGGTALLFDNFDGASLNRIWQPTLPDSPWRFGAGIAFYQGASRFSFERLDGASVIRLHNLLDDAQSRGWSSSRTFRSDKPVIFEARFNTRTQSSTTGIDELLELWLIDANAPDNYDKVALSTPNYGTDRIFTASSSVTGLGVDTDFPFDNNTWYRMVISGSATQEVRASIYDDARSVELIGVGFGHTLSTYQAGFRVGISQSMGLPGAPYPTDVAVDWVRLTHPRSATVMVQGCDSRVPDGWFPSGCALSDLVAECTDRSRSRVKSSHCINHLTHDLARAGVLTRDQRASINACAARSRTAE